MTSDFIGLKTDLQQVGANTQDARFQKTIGKIINLLTELEDKPLSAADQSSMESHIASALSNIQTAQEAKQGLKQLKTALMKNFDFISAGYYTTLGTGVGLAMGTSLGVTFGAVFGMSAGIVFGIGIGSGLGLVAGLMWGQLMDRKKEAENRVLKFL